MADTIEDMIRRIVREEIVEDAARRGFDCGCILGWNCGNPTCIRAVRYRQLSEQAAAVAGEEQVRRSSGANPLPQVETKVLPYGQVANRLPSSNCP